MRILITGGSGFIGTHLARELVARGHETIIFDLVMPQSPVPGVTYVLGDLCITKNLTPILNGVDAVYHLAALVSVPLCQEDPERSYRTNVLATVNLLEFVRAEMSRTKRPIRVFFSSSSAVYGDVSQRVPIREDGFTFTPHFFYGAQKLASESVLRMYRVHYGVPTMIFRLFNVYGSSQASNSSYTGVIAACLNAVNQTGFFNIHGDGTQERDFLSVQDLVRALVLALDLGLEQFTAEPINLGSGRVVTIRELALLIQVLARKSIKLHHTEARQADIKYSCANTQRAREILGWEAKVTLSEGLSELFNKSSSDLIPKRTRAFAVVGDTVRN